MPRSISKIERPRQRRTQPLPPTPEPKGIIAHVPELTEAASEVTAQPASSAPPRRVRNVARGRAPARLADTTGPEPGTPLSRVRLTVGSILGPHGVRGEFKVRLQTDDPEHLLTLKRVFLGDEPAPRTVLGVRLHAGNALMRIQGISSPETVERFRGALLRIRASDARPLAAGEYFLFQIIGLDAFDEAGQRLGRVTDLMETGANDVLVISPEDGGTDLLLPSHPDVILEMDLAEKRIVVRPLKYYGQ